MKPKRLVLFVEGDGDLCAVPILVKRLLTELNAWGSVLLDPNPFKVGSINRLLKDNSRNWIRWLEAAAKRSSPGGVLLLIDGDVKRLGNRVFCAAEAARMLAREAKRARAGDLFSVATVFACQEFESWLIAGVESLAGKHFRDSRPAVRPGTTPPDADLESEPRDAKGWLSRVIESGYNPPRDQAGLTELVDLDLIRNRGMRSFRRLESALTQLVRAARDGRPVVTPG
jgi:hypothetical protein